ncbi:hypothetical protein SAMN05216566_103272 [Aureimonas phyllosphaerae]|nr:hypothetical protein SAMN05216566_103272 [Aureimonas phyllosphaerae]
MAHVLRQVVIGILAVIGIALAGTAIVLIQAGWFSDKPAFGLTGKQTFNCYLERELRYPTLSISFSKNGRQAVIHFPDRDAVTTLQRGGLAGDGFHGDGIEFVVDPEAYVTGYGDKRIGPCQQD